MAIYKKFTKASPFSRRNTVYKRRKKCYSIMSFMKEVTQWVGFYAESVMRSAKVT